MVTERMQDEWNMVDLRDVQLKSRLLFSGKLFENSALRHKHNHIQQITPSIYRFKLRDFGIEKTKPRQAFRGVSRPVWVENKKIARTYRGRYKWLVIRAHAAASRLLTH